MIRKTIVHRRDEIEELLADGFTMAQVATMFDTTRQNIYQIVHREKRTTKILPFIELDNLRFSLQSDGYYTCRIDDHFVKLHRYLYERYIGEIPDGAVVHHKDGNKQNNSLENLELMEFGQHSSMHNSKYDITPEKIAEMKEAREFFSLEEIAELFNCSVKAVSYHIGGNLNNGKPFIIAKSKFGITDNDRKEMVELFKTITVREIAEKFNCTEKAVRYNIKKYLENNNMTVERTKINKEGRETKPPRAYTENDRIKMKEMAATHTLVQIAEKFGCADSTVSRIIGGKPTVNVHSKLGLSEEDHLEMVKLRETKTLQEIADMYHCDKSAVAYRVKQYLDNHPNYDAVIREQYVTQPEEVAKDKKKAYREAHKEKMSAYLKEYREKNKEKAKAYNDEWRAKNKEKLTEYHREYRSAQKD
jgi:predicted DNA-binding protein YlxM (UPF0122 family)